MASLKLFLLGIVICFGNPAAGTEADLSVAYQKIASGKRPQIKKALKIIVENRAGEYAGVLIALKESRLYFRDGVLLIRDNQGYHPWPAEMTAPEGKPRRIRINNSLRRSLNRTLGFLQIYSPDPALRLEAIRLLGSPRDPVVRRNLREVLEKEEDADVRHALEKSLAMVDLDSDDSMDQLAALQVLARTGGQDAFVRLKQMQRSADTDPLLLPDLNRALQKIDMRIFLAKFLANTAYGISLGSIMLMVSLGLAITFGLMGIINMAHGEMIMIGAYTTYVVQTIFSATLPGYLDYYIWLALPASFLVAFLVGIVIELLVIRHLYGRPLETLLATWGLSLILIQTVRMIFGAQNVEVASPSWLNGGWEIMDGLVLPFSRSFAVGVSIIVVLFVWWAMTRTSLGLRVRAIQMNRDMARCVGVDARRVDLLTFGFGSGLAGLAGVILSQIGNVGPELGQGYIIDSFMVVVVGGVGNVLGTVLGATGLGVFNKYLEPFTGAVFGKILILGLIILFIQRRPQGLFAIKGRSIET